MPFRHVSVRENSRTTFSETVQRMFACSKWDARGRQDKNVFTPAPHTSSTRNLLGQIDNLCTLRAFCWCPRRSVNAFIRSVARGGSTRAATGRRLCFGSVSRRFLSPEWVRSLRLAAARASEGQLWGFIDYVASRIMRLNTPQDVPSTNSMMLDLVRTHWGFSSEERFGWSQFLK